jgi:hypothetical protein
MQYVNVEISRKTLEGFRLTGVENGEYHQIIRHGTTDDEVPVIPIWISRATIAVLCFPQPVVVHVPCSRCGHPDPICATPQDLELMAVGGHLCSVCYEAQELARAD